MFIYCIDWLKPRPEQFGRWENWVGLATHLAEEQGFNSMRWTDNSTKSAKLGWVDFSTLRLAHRPARRSQVRPPHNPSREQRYLHGPRRTLPPPCPHQHTWQLSTYLDSFIPANIWWLNTNQWTNARLAYIRSNLWSRRAQASPMAVVLESMQTALKKIMTIKRVFKSFYVSTVTVAF